MAQYFKTGLLLLLVGLIAACKSPSLLVSSFYHNNFLVDSTVSSDPTIDAITNSYKLTYDSLMNNVIAISEYEITKAFDWKENLVGMLFADALLDQSRKLDSEVDFAFGTKGGVRIGLPKGSITLGHIYELMPFENTITILSLSAQQVEELALYILQASGQPVAGLEIQGTPTQVEKISIGGNKIEADKTYKVATYDYIANGGDKVPTMNEPLSRVDYSVKLRDMLISYLKEQTERNQTIKVGNHDRIQIFK